MLRVEPGQDGEGAVLHLDGSATLGLASVLADWLKVYAGMSPEVLSREHFELVVESRRLLLSALEASEVARCCELLDEHTA